jgi:divalent metal cation (Fe/Co/Zn/Cd) transporter
MENRIKYIPSIVTLLAGFIACIVTILSQYEIIDALVTILVVVVIFYMVGLIIRALFNKFLVIKEEKTQATEEAENQEDEASSDSLESVNSEE